MVCKLSGSWIVLGITLLGIQGCAGSDEERPAPAPVVVPKLPPAQPRLSQDFRCAFSPALIRVAPGTSTSVVVRLTRGWGDYADVHIEPQQLPDGIHVQPLVIPGAELEGELLVSADPDVLYDPGTNILMKVRPDGATSDSYISSLLPIIVHEGDDTLEDGVV